MLKRVYLPIFAAAMLTTLNLPAQSKGRAQESQQNRLQPQSAPNMGSNRYNAKPQEPMRSSQDNTLISADGHINYELVGKIHTDLVEAFSTATPHNIDVEVPRMVAYLVENYGFEREIMTKIGQRIIANTKKLGLVTNKGILNFSNEKFENLLTAQVKSKFISPEFKSQILAIYKDDSLDMEAFTDAIDHLQPVDRNDITVFNLLKAVTDANHEASLNGILPVNSGREASEIPEWAKSDGAGALAGGEAGELGGGWGILIGAVVGAAFFSLTA